MDQHTNGTLADQIKQLRLGPGQLALWALGQHGFVLKGGDHTLVIDPYLSNAIGVPRLIPIVIAPDELTMIDTVLITHDHADHCDAETLGPLVRAAPDVQMIGSYRVRDALRNARIGVDVHVPAIDQPLVIDDQLAITPIPSAHYGHEEDEHGNPAFLGYIIRLNGVTLYHSGDTIIYPGMIERLTAQPIDLACLPINGRDWFREQHDLIGNMDYREAADLAAEAGVNVLIAAHNDLFAANRINPAYLIDYLATAHPRQRVHFLQPGEVYVYVA